MKLVKASDLTEKQKKQIEENRIAEENRIQAIREERQQREQRRRDAQAMSGGSGLLKRAREYSQENKNILPTRNNNNYLGHVDSVQSNNKRKISSQDAYILNARKERESYIKPVQNEINDEIRNYYNISIGNEKNKKTSVNKISDTSELAHFQKKLAIQEMANDPKQYNKYRDYIDEQLNNFRKEDAIREGQRQAEETNRGMEEGKYVSTITQYLGNQFGQGVEGFGMGVSNALDMGFAGANKLTSNNIMTKNLQRQYQANNNKDFTDTLLDSAKAKSEIKQLRDYYSQDIDDKGLQFAGKISNQIGNQVPSMALNVLAPGLGLGALGTSAGGRKAIETLNEDNSNYLQALATGTIIGGTEVLTERMFSGNALTRGLNATPLDELASNAVSKVGNPFLRRLAGLGMDVLGENAEELVSNVVERGTDALINGKDFGSGKELLSEAGETIATTTATTMVLAMLGLGGETYNEANQIRANRDAYNQSVKLANLDVNNQSIKSLFNSANSKELTPMFSPEIFENSNDSYKVVEMSDGSKILAINPDANITEVNEQIRKMSNKQLEQITTPMDEDIAEGIRRTAENNYLKEQQQESNRVALQESARQYGINPENETIQQIQSTLSDRGIRSYFDETFFDSPNEGAFYKLSKNEDGSYSREIVFNPNANENTIIQELAVHELTHDIVASNTDVSQSMFQDVMNYLKQDTENFDAVRKSVVNAYTQRYADSDVDVNSPDFQNMIDEELVAKTLQAKLGTQEFINKLHSENRPLFQRFLDWINDKVESFKNRNNAEYKFWKDIQNKFIEAYKNSEFKPGKTNTEINRYSDTVDNNSNLSYNDMKIGERRNISVDEALKLQGRMGYRTAEQVQELRNYIKENGFENIPIEISRNQDGTYSILDGNHRLLIAKEMGIKNIPAIMRGSLYDNVNKQIDISEKAIREEIESQYARSNGDNKGINQQDADSWNSQRVHNGNSNESQNRTATEGNVRLYEEESTRKRNRSIKESKPNIQNVESQENGSFIMPENKTLVSKKGYNTPAKEGTIRLYTNTKQQNVESILKEGLLTNKGRQLEYEGNMTWFETRPDLKGYGGTTIAVDVPSTAQMEKVNDTQYTVFENISPEDIVFVDTPAFNNLRTSDIEEYVNKFGKEKVLEVFDKSNQKYITREQLQNILNNIDDNSTTTRFSIATDGSMQDSKGNKVTLEGETGSSDKTLLALHNLDADKLRGVLELGGFPVPSIAITNPDIVSHGEFGDISVVFNKETINPKSKKNEVYDRDVWSPTFPKIEYEANKDAVSNIRNDLNIDKNYQELDAIQRRANHELSKEEIERGLNSYGLDSLRSILKDNKYIKYAYLKANNEIEPVMEQVTYNKDVSNDALQKFLDEYPNMADFTKSTPLNELSVEQTEQLSDKIKEIVKEDIESKFKDYGEYKQQLIDILLSKYDNYNKLNDFIYSAVAMNREGKTATEIDEDATFEKVNEILNQDEYNEWIDNRITESLIANKGFDNGKGIFTPQGNRRSFKATHNEINLANLVKAMSRGNTKGGQEVGIFGTGFGRISAQTANRFNSIKDIKNNENRLMTREQATEIIQPLSEQLYSNVDELANFYTRKDYNSDTVNHMQGVDTTSEIVEELAGGQLTEERFRRILSEYNSFDVDNIPSDLLNNIIDDLKQVRNLPTDYFEAKPQRAVGFDEIDTVILPKDTDNSLKRQLTDRGIKYIEYDSSNENARADILKSLDEYKFSKTTQGFDEYIANRVGKEGTRTSYKDLGLTRKQILPTGKKSTFYNDTHLATDKESFDNYNKLLKDSVEKGKEYTPNEIKDIIGIHSDLGIEPIFTNNNTEVLLEYDYDIGENYDDLKNFNVMFTEYSDTEDDYNEIKSVQVQPNANGNYTLEGIEKALTEILTEKTDLMEGQLDIEGNQVGANLELPTQETQTTQATQPTQQTPILPPVNNNNIAETNEDGTGKQRRAYKSIIESEYMSDEAKAISKKLMGSDTYIPDSNKSQLQRADERIERNGVTNELATLETNAFEGKTIKADDIAVGDRLIQYYSMIGDEKNLERAVRATAMAGTQAGRAVQAFSMLKHQTPRRNGCMDSN